METLQRNRRTFRIKRKSLVLQQPTSHSVSKHLLDTSTKPREETETQYSDLSPPDAYSAVKGTTTLLSHYSCVMWLQGTGGPACPGGQKVLHGRDSGRDCPSEYWHWALFQHEYMLQEIRIIKVKMCQGLMVLANIDWCLTDCLSDITSHLHNNQSLWSPFYRWRK